MDTWKVRLTLLAVLALSTFAFKTASAQLRETARPKAQAQNAAEGNAVAGIVRDKITNAPLSQVEVFVQPLGDTARKFGDTRHDGLYVLSIPKEISKYALQFHKGPDYIDGFDCGDDKCDGIANDKSTQQRPDMELVPVSATHNMSFMELLKLIEKQRAWIELGRKTKSSMIEGAAKKNLLMIQKANSEALHRVENDVRARKELDAKIDKAIKNPK